MDEQKYNLVVVLNRPECPEVSFPDCAAEVMEKGNLSGYLHIYRNSEPGNPHAMFPRGEWLYYCTEHAGPQDS